MKHQKLIISAIALLTLSHLSGCSSSGERLAEEQAKAEKIREDADQDRRDRLTKKMEDEVDDIVPEWFLEPPKMDSTGIYGVGTASSKNLGFAIRKAKQLAVYETAKTLNQEMSGQERSLQRDDGGDGDVAERTEMLVDTLVRRVPVSGADYVKTEVKPFDGQFHVFVLAKVPFDEYNKVLKQKKSMSDDFNQAFDRLEQRLDKREQQQTLTTQ